jgi:hypothetical protein
MALRRLSLAMAAPFGMLYKPGEANQKCTESPSGKGAIEALNHTANFLGFQMPETRVDGK